MAKVLTQKTIDNLKPAPKRMEVPDAALPGLYFVLQPSGAASWAFRYRVNGRPRKWTIGAYPALSLKEARERAKRGLSQDDPAAAKKAGRRPATVCYRMMKSKLYGTPQESFHGRSEAPYGCCY